MWGLMHLFFMTLMPTVECPHVAEKPVHYKIHAPYPVERPIRHIQHMHKRKGVQRVNHHTRNVLHYLIKMK